MKPGKFLLLIAGPLLMASCSPKIPFTQSIRDQYKLSTEDMRGIQFYLSDPVVLRRGEVQQVEKTTEDGQLVIKSGKSLDEVVFKANTRGAIETAVDQSQIKVAFEEGNDKSLFFGSEGNRDGYYHLQATKWEGGRGKMRYDGQVYYSNKGSDQAILLFKMKSLKKLKVSEKVVKGKKVR